MRVLKRTKTYDSILRPYIKCAPVNKCKGIKAHRPQRGRGWQKLALDMAKALIEARKEEKARKKRMPRRWLPLSG